MIVNVGQLVVTLVGSGAAFRPLLALLYMLSIISSSDVQAFTKEDRRKPWDLWTFTNFQWRKKLRMKWKKISDSNGRLWASEAMLIRVFEEANLCTVHAVFSKVTICPRCYTTFSVSGNDEERKTFFWNGVTRDPSSNQLTTFDDGTSSVNRQKRQ